LEKVFIYCRGVDWGLSAYSPSLPPLASSLLHPHHIAMKFSFAIALVVTFATVSYGAPMLSTPNKRDAQSSDVNTQHGQRLGDIVDSHADSPFSKSKRARVGYPPLGWKRADVDHPVDGLHDWKRNAQGLRADVDRRGLHDWKRDVQGRRADIDGPVSDGLHDWKRGLESEDVDALA